MFENSTWHIRAEATGWLSDRLKEQKANHVDFDPTFTISSAGRDLMRARNADWHPIYTLPSLWAFYQPSHEHHGSFFFDWTTEREVKCSVS